MLLAPILTNKILRRKLIGWTKNQTGTPEKRGSAQKAKPKGGSRGVLRRCFTVQPSKAGTLGLETSQQSLKITFSIIVGLD